MSTQETNSSAGTENTLEETTASSSSDTASSQNEVIQAVMDDMARGMYSAAMRKIDQYQDIDENKQKLNELYCQCIQINSEICERCIALYTDIPEYDILSRLSILRNAAEHIPNQDYLEKVEAYFSDIQYPPSESEQANASSETEDSTPSEKNVNSNSGLSGTKSSTPHVIMPSTTEIAKLSETMTLLLSETDYSKKIDLTNSIIESIPLYIIEQIRAAINLFKLTAFQKELNEAPEEDLFRRITLCQSILELTSDDDIKTQLASYEAEFKANNDRKYAQLVSDYTSNKIEIYNQITANLIQKEFSSAAETIEKYYIIAKEDSAFNDILKAAKQTALSIKTNSLKKQLTSLDANDLNGQKEVYIQLLNLNPFDANYLSKLNQLENILETGNDNSDVQANNENTDCSHDPLVVTDLPEIIDTSDELLQPIENPEIIDKIANFLTTAASICHQGSEIAEKIGDFMHKYSNSPLIQLGACIRPELAKVSPVMEMISDGSYNVSGKFAMGESYLNEAAELVSEVKDIQNTILAIIKPCEEFASACQNMRDVPQELLNDLSDMAHTVANYVVGNYYISQINAKLDAIQNAISKVSDFQDSEYQSKVMALCAQISKMTHFRAEIIDNEELCRRELMKLADYEHECIELLGQANIALSKQCASDLSTFEAYEGNTREMAKWYQYQDSLLHVLSEISRFTFMLNNGTVSIENCSTLFHLYDKQVISVRDNIKAYHKEANTRFEIDLIEKTYKVPSEPSSGFFSMFTSLFDSNTEQSLADDIADIIDIQMNKKSQNIHNHDDLYKKDIRIVFKNNAFYYLPDVDSAQDNEFDIAWVLSVLREGE